MGRMSRVWRGAVAVLPLLVSLSTVRVGYADELDKIIDEITTIGRQAAGLRPSFLKNAAYKGTHYVTERLVDGENFYRMKDYQRSAIIFTDIIDNYPNHAAYIDAVFLYADSLFLSGDYLGARHWYKKFLEESKRPGAGRFKEKAVARLIEVAIHINDYEGVAEYADLLGQFPSDDARYVKGKYLFFKEDLDGALSLFVSITGQPLLQLKALYMTGVILTIKGDYKGAIDVFLKGRSFTPKTKEEQEIIDLMNLGSGRLYYEQGFVSHASECYQRIAQNSPYFDVALYEGASVLIQAGDTIRAEQTLEVLTVAMPDSKYLPKAKMLRGNLLLRTGRYDEAERVFDELVNEFTPLMTQLDKVIEEQRDTRQFFFEIVERSMSSLDVSSILPPLVVKWVGEEAEVQRALNLAKDLGAAKGYIKEVERLILLLEAVLDGPSRINALPMLRQATRRAQELQNQLAQLRERVAGMAEEKLAGQLGELSRLGQERSALQQELKRLPISTGDFKAREKKSQEIFIRMREELARNAIRLDRLTAMAVAIERFIEDPRYTEGVPKMSIDALQAELKRQRYAIVDMQRKMDDLRYDIDRARYQIGIGDAADKRDEELRVQMRHLANREQNIVRSADGRMGSRLDAAFARINKIDSFLMTFRSELEAEANARVRRISEQVKRERSHVAAYNAEIQSLGDEAEEVVGGVAFENFTSVRKKFHDLVLKADVGIIDVVWLKKEEHTSRVGELTKARLKEIKALDDEFQEIKTQETQESE